MSTPKTPGDGLKDEDIQALFDREAIDVPVELDKHILAAARDALNQEPGQDSEQDGSEQDPNQRSHRPSHQSSHQGQQQSSPNEKRPSVWRPGWSQGFATAAVVVLGIVLVPLIMTSQESSFDGVDAELAQSATEAAGQQSTPSAASVESIAEDQSAASISTRERELQNAVRANSARKSANLSSFAAESDEIEAYGAASIAEPAAPAPASVESLSISDSFSDAEPDAAVLGELQPSTATDTSYREAPQSWITEILRLHENQQTEQSREEVLLFIKRYPDHDLIDKLPQEIR